MFADGSIISRILGTLILIVIIAGPIYLFMRSRNSSWTGVVTGKKIKDGVGEELETTHSFVLLIKKDGATKAHEKVVSSQAYNEFAVGDKVAKKSGKMDLLKA